MNELILPEGTQAIEAFSAINQFQQIVHSQMIEGHDYGKIPGTPKPTLLKPGAEKIAKLLGLSDDYEILDRQEDWTRGFFRYLIKCRLSNIGSGALVSSGLGECNSMESKYRWRETKRKCPVCGSEAIIKGKAEYGGGWICYQKKGGCGQKWSNGDAAIENQITGKVENDDIFSQVNTILKMAKKRALVDAALSAGRLSNLFTQDMEDMVIEAEYSVTEEATKEDKKTTKKSQPKQTADTSSSTESQKPQESHPTHSQEQSTDKPTDYNDVMALAKRKGLGTTSKLCDAYGLQAIKQMTPDAWITELNKMPDEIQEGMIL